MTKSDFDTWKHDPITIAFYEAMVQRIDDCKELLAASAGIDQINDNFNRGFITAYTEALEFRVEDVE